MRTPTHNDFGSFKKASECDRGVTEQRQLSESEFVSGLRNILWANIK